MRNQNKHSSLTRAVEYGFKTKTGHDGLPVLLIKEKRLIEGVERTANICICEADMKQFAFLLQQAFVEMQIQEQELPMTTVVQEAVIIETEQQAKTYCLAEVRKKYPRAYMPWDQEEDDELVHQFCQGYKVKDMALHFGRGRGAISARIKKLGLRDIYDLAV